MITSKFTKESKLSSFFKILSLGKIPILSAYDHDVYLLKKYVVVHEIIFPNDRSTTMKISTTTATLFLIGESYAAAHKSTSTSRKRSIKLYSFKTEHGTVDPYIGLPDERRQRSLEKLSMPLSTLEMSMPTTAASLTDQSFSYALQGSVPAAENAVRPVAVIAAAEEAYNSATMMGHSSVVVAAAAAIVSAIVGVVALV